VPLCASSVQLSGLAGCHSALDASEGLGLTVTRHISLDEYRNAQALTLTLTLAPTVTPTVTPTLTLHLTPTPTPTLTPTPTPTLSLS
jgi:hypothetical protein